MTFELSVLVRGCEQERQKEPVTEVDGLIPPPPPRFFPDAVAGREEGCLCDVSAANLMECLSLLISCHLSI